MAKHELYRYWSRKLVCMYVHSIFFKLFPLRDNQCLQNLASKSFIDRIEIYFISLRDFLLAHLIRSVFQHGKSNKKNEMANGINIEN